MKCCGHDVTSVELQVADQPYVLFRCGDCNSGYWLRDGQQVPLDEVTAALRRQAAQKAAVTSGRVHAL